MSHQLRQNLVKYATHFCDVYYVKSFVRFNGYKHWQTFQHTLYQFLIQKGLFIFSISQKVLFRGYKSFARKPFGRLTLGRQTFWIHRRSQGILRGKYHCTIDLLFDWFGISCMTTDNFCFYLQNKLIQTSPTGGQLYCDTSPFSIPCPKHNDRLQNSIQH